VRQRDEKFRRAPIRIFSSGCNLYTKHCVQGFLPLDFPIIRFALFEGSKRRATPNSCMADFTAATAFSLFAAGRPTILNGTRVAPTERGFNGSATAF
jgi:hypothetical protein